MLDLIYEYKRSLRNVKKIKDKYLSIPEKKRTLRDESDIELINNMISDLEYIIEWLTSGRQPRAKRGYDRREVYKRMVFYDPKILDISFGESFDLFEEKEESSISEWDIQRIEDALSVLTEREKDIFIMNKVHRFSYEYIAELLNVKKGTVQTHIKRAEKKLKKQTQESLFCFSE